MPQPYDTPQVSLYPDGAAILNDYTLDPGVCVLPLAEDPPTSFEELKTWSPVVILRLHAPYRIRRLRHQSTKENGAPVMPSPVDSGAFKFVGGNVVIATALNQTFHNFDFTVVSDYLFVENCVSRPQDGFILGSPPWPYDTGLRNARDFPPTVGNPPVGSGLLGAIRFAGTDVRVGYTQAQEAVQAMTASVDPNTGAVITPVGYGYNTPSFFPGQFLNDQLVNGGPGGVS